MAVIFLQRKRQTLSVIIGLITAFFLITPSVCAAQSVLQLTPFLIEQDTHRGQTLQEQITVANLSDRPKFLTLSINDFLPAGNDGETQILPPDESAPSQVSLSRWIEIQQQPKYELQPQESTEIKFAVKIPVDAEAGAHYGALVFTLGDEQVPTGQTEIRQQAATLIILDIDRSFERGNISNFSLAKVGNQSSELEFLMNFRNSGLSSLKPKGRIMVYNIFGRFVGQTYINRDANTVLPNTDRLFVSKLPGDFWGRYTAVADATFGSTNMEARTVLVFWVWPSALVLLRMFLFAAIIIIILIIAIRRYNAWVVAKAINKKPHE